MSEKSANITTMPAAAKAPVYSPEPIFPLSVEAYHELIASGQLGEDDPVELIEGVLVFSMPKNKAHAVCLAKLMAILVRAVPPEWMVRAQDPITLPDGEPEPDLVIASAAAVEASEWHPTPADLALVIEIADSSLERDRTMKLRSYARAGIATYWIVNLNERVVEVYAGPTAEPIASYREFERLAIGDAVRLPASVGGSSIAVADFL